MLKATILVFLFAISCGDVTESRVQDDVCFPLNLMQTSPFSSCYNGTCRCSAEAVDCSVANMSAVPVLGEDVRFLKLSQVTIHVYPFEYRKQPQFFANAENITHLSLSGSSLIFEGEMWATVFDHMKNLTCLNIDKLITKFSDFVAEQYRSVFFSYLLVLPTLRILSAVQALDSMQVRLGEIYTYDYTKPVPTLVLLSPLENLILSNNNDIKNKMDWYNSLCFFKQGKELDLSNCGLMRMKENGPTRCSYKLQALRLEHNMFQVFPQTCRTYSVREMSVSLNISMFPQLTFLNLSYNQISALVNDKVPEICLPNLKTLDLSENILLNMFLLPGSLSASLCYAPKLAQIYLDGQRKYYGELPETSLPKTKVEASSLVRLSFARNQVDFSSEGPVSDLTFVKYSKMTELVLDRNDFSKVDENRFGQLFGAMVKLSKLSLGYCELRDLQFIEAVPDLLSHLVLTGNSLTGIPDGAFDHLPGLRHLDLSFNSIAAVSETTFSEVTRQRFVSVNLGSNPYICTCDVLWFRAWLLKEPSVLYGKSPKNRQYQCKNLPNRTIEEFNINQRQCLLSREASVAIIVSCVFILVLLSLALFLSRYRWHIRLFLYDLFRGRNDNARRYRVKRFRYDVFVSYDSHDAPWVRGHLMPELESRLGLRLCIHERDFIPGQQVLDNIARCVQTSKKVMMVFSKNFVLSQWCQFELTYCLTHVMDYNDVLIVVCLDDVASRQMTTAMKAVINTTTYLQWPRVHYEPTETFWGRLRVSLEEVFDNTRAQHV